MPHADGRSPDHRLRELDGLRGWASLSVLLFHVFWEIFGTIIPEFQNFLTAGLFNGALSVSIFFVLSGEALSAAYWRTGDRLAVTHMALKRYPRLTIPIFWSCLIVFILIKADLVFSADAAVIVHRPDWLGSFLLFSADANNFLRYSLIGVYGMTATAEAYNPFLWTMRTEILGSFMVFLVLLAERYLARVRVWLPVAVLLGLATLFFVQKSLLACFMFGALFGLMHARGHFARLRSMPWVATLSVAIMLVGLAFSAHKQIVGHSGARPFTVIAVCFVFFAHCNAPVTAFLRDNPLSRFLGRISFTLYLVHFPVIISLTSFLIVTAKPNDILHLGTALAIAALTVAASIAAAMLFLPIETLTHWICRRIGRLLPSRRAVPA